MTILLDPIFTRDAKGALRQWIGEVDEATGAWRGVAGIVGMVQTPSGWVFCEPKSQATPAAQAEFEARAERRKKLDRGYAEKAEEVDSVSFIRCMLAEPWLDAPHDFSKGPLWLQPKLDGYRCVTPSSGLWSRKGKRFASSPHIQEHLEPVFAVLPELTLDGELYNHLMSAQFQKLGSLIRKGQNSKKPVAVTAEDLAETRDVVQYHLYGVVDVTLTHEEQQKRLAWVKAHLDRIYGVDNHPVRIVPSVLVHSEEEMWTKVREFIALGYEGGIGRVPGMLYQQKRSKQLTKIKLFDEEEFNVRDIREGTGSWAGHAKEIIVDLEDGRPCGAGLKGDMPFAKDLLENKAEYIGSPASVRFFGRTDDGLLRNATVQRFHPGGRTA